MKSNSNRPAYPLSSDKFTKEVGYGFSPDNVTGLTKREYFAAIAMQGLLSNPEYIRQLSESAKAIPSFDSNGMCVRESLDMADELLRQLDK